MCNLGCIYSAQVAAQDAPENIGDLGKLVISKLYSSGHWADGQSTIQEELIYRIELFEGSLSSSNTKLILSPLQVIQLFLVNENQSEDQFELLCLSHA